MNIFLYIYIFFNFLIWGIVPFRQKGEKYFLFFFILICGEIITIAHFFIRPASLFFTANFFYIFSALLRFISVQEKNISKLTTLFILIIAIITVTLEIHGLMYKQEFVLLCFFHFLVLFKFLQNFIIKFALNRTINIFLGCLILYEITATTKYFGLITGFANAGLYLIITTVFEVLVGIFFCLFKESSPRLLINLDKLQDNFSVK
jgi:hypothetical protein